MAQPLLIVRKHIQYLYLFVLSPCQFWGSQNSLRKHFHWTLTFSLNFELLVLFLNLLGLYVRKDTTAHTVDITMSISAGVTFSVLFHVKNPKKTRKNEEGILIRICLASFVPRITTSWRINTVKKVWRTPT